VGGYQRWRLAGDVALEAIRPLSATADPAAIPQFDAHVFRHLYPVCRGRRDRPTVIEDASAAADPT
jgi:hypothetical protein